MNPIALLTSFSGRINRAKWWLGMILILVLSIIASIAVNPNAMQAYTSPEAPNLDINAFRPTLAQLIVGLIMTFFVLALVFKRLNDRNWPTWVGIMIAVIYVGVQIAQYLALQSVGSIEEIATATIPTTIISSIVFLFLLIDNGMLKGTAGPNQYGEDPLAHKNTDMA